MSRVSSSCSDVSALPGDAQVARPQPRLLLEGTCTPELPGRAAWVTTPADGSLWSVGRRTAPRVNGKIRTTARTDAVARADARPGRYPRLLARPRVLQRSLPSTTTTVATSGPSASAGPNRANAPRSTSTAVRSGQRPAYIHKILVIIGWVGLPVALATLALARY